MGKIDWAKELELPTYKLSAESLSVVRTINHEHRELAVLIEQLDVAMQNPQCNIAPGDVLDALLAEVERHFTSEEQLMRERDYPALIAHRQEHRKLVDNLSGMVRDCREYGALVPGDVMTFLKEWLKGHTLGADADFFEFFSKTDLRFPPQR